MLHILTTLAAIICISLFNLSDVHASPHKSSSSSFYIQSHGLKIGRITSRTSLTETPAGGRVYRFSNTTRIKANMIFKSYELESHEEATVSNRGTVSYSRTSRENGVSTAAKGHLQGDEFHVSIKQDNTARTLVFHKKQYEYTTMECPETTLRHPGQTVTMKILDLETLEIINRRYSFVKTEHINVNGKPVNCMVIDFEDKNKKGRRWIKPDHTGVLIARQDGRSKSGSYSVRLLEHISR